MLIHRKSKVIIVFKLRKVSFPFAISISFCFALKQDAWVLQQGIAASWLKLRNFEYEVEVSEGDLYSLHEWLVIPKRIIFFGRTALLGVREHLPFLWGFKGTF